MLIISQIPALIVAPRIHNPFLRAAMSQCLLKWNVKITKDVKYAICHIMQKLLEMSL